MAESLLKLRQGLAKSGQVMGMRALVFLVAAVTLGGCMQEVMEPASEASWKPRDRALMLSLIHI